MKVPVWVAVVFAYIVAVVIAFAICMQGEASGNVFKPRHNPLDPSHWYDIECCDLDDCKPISGVKPNGEPWSEVTETPDGYRWQSSQSGEVYFFPKIVEGAPNKRIRPSRDGFFHGCESIVGHEDKHWVGHCLYIPLLG